MNHIMQAVEISSFGGPEVLRLAERPMPQPGVGELLIRVGASGINRPDVLQRLGHYAPPPGTSDLPGLEVAGVVESGDESALAAAGIRIGDRVCALVAGGGYAQWCVAPVAQCLPVPHGLSDIEAASLPETFFTVWSNVFNRGRLQAGESLLVPGGHERHWCDSHPVGPRVWRDGHCDGGQRRKMRSLLVVGCKPRHSLQIARFRSGGSTHHRGPRRGCGA